MSFSKFNWVVVFNRGEVAVWFICGARIWSLIYGKFFDVIVFYTYFDSTVFFVRMVSKAILLGEPFVAGFDGGMRSVYLDIDWVIKITKDAGVMVFWFGWGFLVESVELVDVCKDALIIFIGLSGYAIRLLGDKIEAKCLVEQYGVSVSVWFGGVVDGVKDVFSHVKRIGYFALFKAIVGGGGRGIRVVRKPEDMEEVYNLASNEAAFVFGNVDLFVE